MIDSAVIPKRFKGKASPHQPSLLSFNQPMIRESDDNDQASIKKQQIMDKIN